MARITVRKTTIRNKNNSNQKKLRLRRVAIKNSMNKFKAAMR